jgi:hypothetical protein
LPVELEATGVVAGLGADEPDRAQRHGAVRGDAVALVDLERAQLVFQRMREIAQDVLQEAQGAQRAGDGGLVSRGLETLERLRVEVERHAVIE